MQPSQIAGIAFSLVSVSLIQHFGRALHRGRASHGWRKTDGYIVGRGTPIGGLQRLEDAAAVPTYTYSVNGVEYTSSRYDVAGTRSGAGAAAAFADHVVGQRVTVWYDPAEPGRAVLVPGMQSSSYQRLLSGVALLVVGVSFLIAGTVESGRKPAKAQKLTSAQATDSVRH
jgi:hypothetical protein